MVFTTNQLFKSSAKYLLAITAIITVLPLPVKAATFLVTERAVLEGNDEVDWVSLGKVFNPSAPDFSAFLSNSFLATSQGGLELDINIAPTNNPQITPPFVFQTLPPPGIRTNFAQGDFILFGGIDPTGFQPLPPGAPDPRTQGNGGPFSISFARPVFGAGTQIAVDISNLEVETFITAFDNANNLLGSFSVISTSSLALDNSAVFLGIRSDTPNISRVVFSSSYPQYGLAINQVSIIAVPEPTYTLALLAFGVSGTILKLRQRT
ncbi:hypothetical protein FNW02_20440 [Komarekiella sp. 'clone 1']|uniref:PEP-CTERM protein-sorting domain-containing protein n=1 Tax=Komarekiella delphini-convector SJRDD-AB1 TaxID=2593771 RepID=A0AA40SZI1_9NOST|nr:hypothetical protein [Komarekiella delphini-convector]MBD6618128.1 hypothetical protein [Komarekiella delphini-convector SJRDD-AB1]